MISLLSNIEDEIMDILDGFQTRTMISPMFLELVDEHYEIKMFDDYRFRQILKSTTQLIS